MKEYIFDIEADGLKFDATTIWCVVVKEVGASESQVYLEADKDSLQELFNGEALFIGHNVMQYDVSVLERIWGIHIPYYTVRDTLIISRMLKPDIDGGHGLAKWGERFGFPKIEYNDFSKLTLEMIKYCKRDVDLTEKVWLNFKPKIKPYLLAINLDHKFAHYMNLQEENGFTLDIKKALVICKDLSKSINEQTLIIQQSVPLIKVIDGIYKESQKDGRLINETEDSYTYITKKTKILKTKDFKYEKFNPNSRKQIADYFIKKYNWVPELRTDKGSPMLDGRVLSNLDFPEAKQLAKIHRWQKQLGMIWTGENSWLKHEHNGRVHGLVTVNGTNTGRCSHQRPNLAQVDKKDLRMRECWIPKAEYKLVGIDASGLELRILGHYLYRWDHGKFIQNIIDGDIHVHNQEIMGVKERQTAKNISYALIYGAGDKKLGLMAGKEEGIDVTQEKKLRKLGKSIRDKINVNLTGYKEVMKLIADTLKGRNHLKCIDGRPLYPRTDYSALNLLIQAAGAQIMKQALINFVYLLQLQDIVLGVDFNLCANVHDEFQVECKPELAKIIGKMGCKAITQVQDDFGLKCPLAGEYKIGNSWAETH